MARLAALLLLLLAAPATACEPSVTRLGVVANGIQTPADRTATERSLGVAYARPNAALIGATAPQAQNASSQAARLRTVVTIVNRTGGSQPSAPPDDLAAYAEGVRRQLRLNRPALVTVENEEIAANFYSGTPAQYLVQLEAAVRVAHDEGYRITNGGLVSNATALMTWDDLWSRGKHAEADDYATRVWDPSRAQERTILDDIPTSANPTRPILGRSPAARALYDRARALMAGYRASDMDYVNFHWYHRDTKALAQSIAFLQRSTGKPAVTNEIGQYDQSPATTTAILGALVKARVRYALWYAADGPPSYGLYGADRVLRPNGLAFRAFATDLAVPCRPAKVSRLRVTRKRVTVKLSCRNGGRTCTGSVERRRYAITSGRSRTVRARVHGRTVRITRDGGSAVDRRVPHH